MSAPRTLVLAWGNPGRGDDGLGPAFAELLADEAGFGLTVDSTYQLQVEDALTVSRFARVVFVDAARAGARAFRLAAIAPRAEFAFTTHALSPRSVLALARELYGKSPSARMLAIRGYDFGLGESLSARAETNLGAALKRLAAFIGEKPDSAAPPRRHPRPPRRKPL